MADYSYPCSRDGHGLRFKGFSIVLLQIFTLDKIRPDGSPAPALPKDGFLRLKSRSIDELMFIMQHNGDTGIERYAMDGFDFEMPLKNPYQVNLKGHCSVEMGRMFGKTICISYRFLFDGKACVADKELSTDHLIAILSTHLSAEHWSKNKNENQTDINYEVEGFAISGLRLDEKGALLKSPTSIELNGAGRAFDVISKRYRRYVQSWWKGKPCIEFLSADYHYAMVDIWEDLMHPLEDGSDLFSKEHPANLSEADIVNHIRDCHKEELIGLMTLYPAEWPYRDAEAYDVCCGPNIAIDTDDLVLANNNMSVVIGTYGRRGGAEAPVDWEEHLQERAEYHCSWPEFLAILETVLAKKYVLGYARDELVNATLKAKDGSAKNMIAHNADLSLRLSRMELMLDMVKYSKFMSHKVMFDRTTARLEVDRDLQSLHDMMEIVDNSLHNISDQNAAKSNFLLNFILAIISMASTFELFFQKTEIPALTYFGWENSRFAAMLVCCVAFVTILGLLVVVANTVKALIENRLSNK